MKTSVKPGKYVIAVSGGVDSMVLLDVLSKQPGVELVVAHFDHGIRDDSNIDRQLVETAAANYGLPFVYEQGNLGATASEAQAREARYAFLRRVKTDHQAQAIITAHHADDGIETAIINLLRGTGRKGLNALQSTADILRPLLHVSKQDIYDYAQQQRQQGHSITWREDSTNQTDQYLRNYIRHHVVEAMSPAERDTFLSYIAKAGEVNPQIDALLLRDMGNAERPDELNRYWFIMLPYDVSCEVMAAWLRQNNLRDFDRKGIARLVVTAKVAIPGKAADINAGYLLKTDKTVLRITRGTRS
jgi:tRNA(Ile)-lysidine synthetase-like protein